MMATLRPFLFKAQKLPIDSKLPETALLEVALGTDLLIFLIYSLKDDTIYSIKFLR